MYLAGALYYWETEEDGDFEGKDMEAMVAMLCTGLIINVVMWFILQGEIALKSLGVFLFIAFFATSFALGVEMHDYDGDTVLNWFIAFIIAFVILIFLLDTLTLMLIWLCETPIQ
jgi:hypothetical protein